MKVVKWGGLERGLLLLSVGWGQVAIFGDLLWAEANNPYSRSRVLHVVRHMRNGGGVGGWEGSELSHQSS